MNWLQFELPEELIAQYPVNPRSASRLLVSLTSKEQFYHSSFKELPEWLTPSDLLVFNDTRVMPARLLGKKASGGQVELLIERLLPAQKALAQIRCSKPPLPTSILWFEGLGVEVLKRIGLFYEVKFLSSEPIEKILEKYGHIPLPPYLNRPDEPLDRWCYQTVYAQYSGSVAAPTAGLHFDLPLLDRLRNQGISMAFVTLHVGAGTFLPLREEQLQTKQLHEEWLTVSQEVCAQIVACRQRGGRVIGVGTTTVRALETAFAENKLNPYVGETQLFIQPGYQFQVVDAMITNFHLPRSSLLYLVAAFAGQGWIEKLYQEAIAQKYRFYSYGDAMLLLP